MDAPEKIVVIVTHGPDHAELATIPFVMAAGSLASDVELVMAFQAEGVELLTKGGADGVQAKGFPVLAELMQTVQDLGGQLLGCSPCLEGRALTEADLRDGVEVIGAARLIAEVTSATTTLTY
jgi:predicted peroxiredoxin